MMGVFRACWRRSSRSSGIDSVLQWVGVWLDKVRGRCEISSRCSDLEQDWSRKRHIIDAIQSNARTFSHWTFTHIRREANKIAHELRNRVRHCVVPWSTYLYPRTHCFWETCNSSLILMKLPQFSQISWRSEWTIWHIFLNINNVTIFRLFFKKKKERKCLKGKVKSWLNFI